MKRVTLHTQSFQGSTAIINVSKQSVKVSVSTHRECCQECRNNPPEVLNLHLQWLDLGNTS